jgi:hypothetical protein
MGESELAWISIVAGVLFVLVALGLALAKIDPNKLRKKSHGNPGLTLYRFAAYRWAMVIILFALGLITLVSGWNSLSVAN